MTYKTVKRDKRAGKRISVSKKGNVTVEGPLEKRTYRVKVRATATGDAACKPASQTVTLKVKVV